MAGERVPRSVKAKGPYPLSYGTTHQPSPNTTEVVTIPSFALRRFDNEIRVIPRGHEAQPFRFLPQQSREGRMEWDKADRIPFRGLELALIDLLFNVNSRSGKVDVLPEESEHFPASRSGIEGDMDWKMKTRFMFSRKVKDRVALLVRPSLNRLASPLLKVLDDLAQLGDRAVFEELICNGDVDKATER
jgi:hypothetical protein